MSYCALGSRILLKQLGKMNREMDGVRNHASEDTEHVHRMRVATRRLRSALALFPFCFPARQIQVWEKEIKHITRILGETRDTDVQLLTLCDVLKNIEDPSLETGIRRLFLRIRQGREILQEKVLKALDRFSDSGVEESMVKISRKVLGKARIQKIPEVSGSLFNTAVERCVEKMTDVLSYDDFVRDPGNVEQLHALRKSTKGLRYTLEFYDVPYNKELSPYIDELKNLQTLLGEIHDCDFWIDFIPLFLEDETQRTRIYYGNTRSMAKIRKGIDFLCNDRMEKRKFLYENFINTWNRLFTENFWEKLQSALLQRSPGIKTGEVTGK